MRSASWLARTRFLPAVHQSLPLQNSQVFHAARASYQLQLRSKSTRALFGTAATFAAGAATIGANVLGTVSRQVFTHCEDLSALVGAPTAAYVPPGHCVFGEEFASAKLLERVSITHDTILLTFGLCDEAKPLGLSTCACILAAFKEDGAENPIVRPYTPVSTNAMIGKFQLVVKTYDGGKMSQHMSKLPIGGELLFKHIKFNVKIQYPFRKKHLVMLVGGTGITPMIQALHVLLATPGDITKITMIYGNKAKKDILCEELLAKWQEAFPDRLKVVHVLSEAADDTAWVGEKGFITKDLISKFSPPVNEDTMVFVCGPPPMYAALCGPRDKPAEITGALAELGYTKDMVVKF